MKSYLPIIFTILFSAASCFFYITNPVRYWEFFQGGNPEGYIELVQFGFYLVAGVILTVVGVLRLKKLRNLVSMTITGFGVLVIAVAFEEVSWGKKILNFETPKRIGEANSQGELTIHNLKAVQDFLHLGYIFAGLSLTGMAVFSRKLGTKYRAIDGLLPNVKLSPFYFLVAGFYFWIDYINSRLSNPVKNHQEFFETLFSAGIMLWALQVYRQSKPHSDVA